MADKEFTFLTPEESAKLLYESGLLFVINREILHPFGLALASTFDDSGNPSGFCVADDRFNDDEGISYAKSTLFEGAVKYDKFLQDFGNSKIAKRIQKLGYKIQPLQFSFDAPVQEVTQPTTGIDNSNIKDKHTTKTPSGNGAAVRTDLVPETESFSSLVKSSGFAPNTEGEKPPEIEIRHKEKTRFVDVSKLNIVNKTKYTTSCPHPQENIVREALGAGGHVMFCSLCGAQFSDTDLTD